MRYSYTYFMTDYGRNGEDFGEQPTTSSNPKLDALFKHGLSDVEALRKLRQEYANDEKLIADLFTQYKTRKEHLLKKARKFKHLIYNRYQPMGLSDDQLIMKARKYQTKYKLSNEEFRVFYNLAISDSAALQAVLHDVPNTQLSRTLGYDIPTGDSGKLVVSDEQLGVVQKILQLAGETKAVHDQVFMQSLMYDDCSPEAFCGKFNPEKHDRFNYVHPVVAALFLPKIDILERNMIHSSIGRIVEAKQAGRRVESPHFELYTNLVTDPNERTCSSENPIKDLHNRFLLQTKLWSSILNLRQGRYYAERTTDFLNALESCKNNIYDSPDMTYVKDEGTVLRKLLGAFSFRPTIVSATKLFGYGSAIPQSSCNKGVIDAQARDMVAMQMQMHQQQGLPLGAMTTTMAGNNMTSITTVPMITVRLPAVKTAECTISLESALDQPQYYVENKMVVHREQQIVNSHDVLFFYAGRRMQTLNFSMRYGPQNFCNLPLSVAGNEILNDHCIDVQPEITVGADKFTLRSVVYAETIPIKVGDQRRNIVVGCSAGIRFPTVGGVNKCVIYDPFSVSGNCAGAMNGPMWNMVESTLPTDKSERSPVPAKTSPSVGAVPAKSNLTGADCSSTTKTVSTGCAKSVDSCTGKPSCDYLEDQSFFGKAKRQGTIFVYQKSDTVGKRDLPAVDCVRA